MKPIIKVEGLAKSYRLGAQQASYQTLREALAGAVRAPLRRLGVGARDATRTLWALDDVSFQVAPGEVLGIIGRNGAGKSTLLKILTRITEPTKGRVELYGRVGSLLEVGTGFHPELTGRENIYLNGAILGMRRAEITRRFDEIVAFAETEKFLDTPVKRYSSGMYMRLAFAVAAHMESEILLVDEVLAVGDHEFQKKCLGKMKDVSEGGRTVLFVSHNMEAVRTLCTRGLFLDCGHIAEDAAPSVVIEKALASFRETPPGSFRLQTVREAAGVPQPAWVEVRAAGKPPGEMITFDDDIHVMLELTEPVSREQTFSLAVLTNTGAIIFNSFYRDNRSNPMLVPGETTRVTATIPRQLLPKGVYEAVFGYMLPNAQQFWMTRDTWFEVHEIESYRNEGLTVNRVGLVSLVLPWTNE